jgi:transposase
MANRVKTVTVSAADRMELERRVRSQTGSARDARRARIVLLAAEGRPAAEIAELVGCSVNTAGAWRSAYVARGLAGLEDQPRSGRPPVVNAAKQRAVLWHTLTPPPDELGVTHWSSRLLARYVGLHFTQVAAIWRRWGIQPWREETFKFSTDPQLEAKVRDVIGLYLDPPANAVVLCIDEKAQIQALDRTQPMLPVRPGLPASRTHDYVRHGTTTLFAALEIATGKITDACYSRHRNIEFLKFLRQVAKAYPRRKLHIVVDNYAAHKHPNVTKWLKANPRVRLHFTPTSGSWLNLVEAFFAIITRQAIHRGTFTSVPDLINAIGQFIDAYNDRCKPFVWTKTADEVLAHCKPPNTLTTGH